MMYVCVYRILIREGRRVRMVYICVYGIPIRGGRSMNGVCMCMYDIYVNTICIFDGLLMYSIVDIESP